MGNVAKPFMPTKTNAASASSWPFVILCKLCQSHRGSLWTSTLKSTSLLVCPCRLMLINTSAACANSSGNLNVDLRNLVQNEADQEPVSRPLLQAENSGSAQTWPWRLLPSFRPGLNEITAELLPWVPGRCLKLLRATTGRGSRRVSHNRGRWLYNGLSSVISRCGFLRGHSIPVIKCIQSGKMHDLRNNSFFLISSRPRNSY